MLYLHLDFTLTLSHILIHTDIYRQTLIHIT